MLKAIRLTQCLLTGLTVVAGAALLLSPKGATTPTWAGGVRVSTAGTVVFFGLIPLNAMLTLVRWLWFRVQGRLVRLTGIEAITGDRVLTFGPVEMEGPWLLTFRVTECGAVVDLEWPGDEEPPVRVRSTAGERSWPSRTSRVWVESAGRLAFAFRARLVADSAYREQSFRLTRLRRPGEVVIARWVLTVTGPGRVLAFPPEPARDDEAMGFPVVVPAAGPVPAIPVEPLGADEKRTYVPGVSGQQSRVDGDTERVGNA